jgi:catechol 2,3-dioxygenase-like lactoylglutathione lyase family enzyme
MASRVARVFSTAIEASTTVNQTLGMLTLLVREYDEAIRFYTERLGFDLLEDTDLGNGKRWVRVAPPGSTGAALLLAKAATPEQAKRIGDQAGGRVFLFLHTDELARDYERYRAAGVRFEETPRREAYGMVAVFQDLYGNRWDLLELNKPDR